MSKSEWESRNSDQSTAKNADQAEILAVRYKACPLDEGVRDDRTADAMDDFGALDTATSEVWAVDDSKVDDAVGATACEIERRAALMGDAYPFIKDGNTLKYRQSHTLAYELCLAIANAQTVVSKPFNRLPPAFERLCRDVVACFMGEGACKLRTGWPLDGEKWRTSKFKSIVDKIHAETSEWVWQPGPGMPDDPNHQNAKDLGIDFVVWKRIPDNRRGMLFLLGQCACGDDWTNKFDDLNVRSIGESWFRYFSVVDPVRLFCIPRHIANSTYFDEINRMAGFTFDRARIAIIAESESNRELVQKGSHLAYAELVRLVVQGFEVDQLEHSPLLRKAAAAPHSQ